MPLLELESGGHRIQRIPPTEKRNRVHTSTVTVAVLPIASETVKKVKIPTTDVRIEWFSGTGPGGQFRNKHQNSCRLTHIPTGMIVTSQKRSRKNSLSSAWNDLAARLTRIHHDTEMTRTGVLRHNLIGSGMRADKIRTYRFQDDKVTDHNSSKTAKASQIMKGNFRKLH